MAIIGKQQDKNIPGKFDKLLYGYIDKTGEIVIEPKFYEARPFKEGLAAVKVVDKYGFINNVGEMVIATVFRHVMYDFSEGFACVLQKSDEGFFFIDKEGNNIFNRFFPTPSTFSEGLAPISIYREYDEEDKILYKANQWGYIDKTGKVIIEFPIVIKKSS